jgi:hypothetical protein
MVVPPAGLHKNTQLSETIGHIDKLTWTASRKMFVEQVYGPLAFKQTETVNVVEIFSASTGTVHDVEVHLILLVSS